MTLLSSSPTLSTHPSTKGKGKTVVPNREELRSLEQLLADPFLFDASTTSSLDGEI